ncbi:peptide methionine sulfoxide reductase [Runella sp.]|uniref:peptide methionine sulfoxide reductase n=1 Tax=Runella sp. TaxID=1960881 RepID=UPI003D0F74C5
MGLPKRFSNQNHSFQIYAEELGGNDFISLNYYVTGQKELLKPCEMPEEKVINFFKNVELLGTALNQ